MRILTSAEKRRWVDVRICVTTARALVVFPSLSCAMAGFDKADNACQARIFEERCRLSSILQSIF